MDRTKIALAGLSVVCTTLALTAAITPAFSQPGSEAVVVKGRAIDPETQRVVTYRDLNLADSLGRKTLLRRVDYAVDDLCDSNVGVNALTFYSRDRACAKAAWASANPQIKEAFDVAIAGGTPTVAIAIVAAVPTK